MAKLKCGLIQMGFKGDTAADPDTIRDVMLDAHAPFIDDAGNRGVYVNGGSDVTILKNEVLDSIGHGIYVRSSNDVTVADNYVVGSGRPRSGETRKGIYLNAITNAVVSGNLAEANFDAGIFVSNGSAGILIKGNTTRDNARVYARAAAGSK